LTFSANDIRGVSMKNMLSTLLLSCVTFLSCQHAYAGLVGEQLFVGYNAYFSNGEGDPTFLQDSATFTVEAPFLTTLF